MVSIPKVITYALRSIENGDIATHRLNPPSQYRQARLCTPNYQRLLIGQKRAWGRSMAISSKRTSGQFRQIHIDEIDVASPDLAASFVGGATEKTPG